MFIPFRDGKHAEHIIIPVIMLIVLKSIIGGYPELTFFSDISITLIYIGESSSLLKLQLCSTLVLINKPYEYFR